MKNPIFSVGIVFYSQETFLEKCISSLLEQTEKRFEILFRDNSPEKNGRTFLEKNFPNEIQDQKIKIFCGENLWHSGGHNFLYKKMSGEAYICASTDMCYKKNFLETLKKNREKENYCITGKVLDYEGKKIDSAGLKNTFYTQVFDRGQAEEKEKYSSTEKIFGASGALFSIEKKFVEKELNGKIFPEKLHYKNDCYLFYTLHYKNFSVHYTPEVFAYHARKVSESSKKSFFETKSSFYGQKAIFTEIILKKGMLSEQFFGAAFLFLQWGRYNFLRLKNFVFNKTRK